MGVARRGLAARAALVLLAARPVDAGRKDDVGEGVPKGRAKVVLPVPRPGKGLRVVLVATDAGQLHDGKDAPFADAYGLVVVRVPPVVARVGPTRPVARPPLGVEADGRPRDAVASGLGRDDIPPAHTHIVAAVCPWGGGAGPAANKATRVGAGPPPSAATFPVTPDAVYGVFSLY